MPIDQNKKQDFATYGQDAYNLSTGKEEKKVKEMKDDEIILNILEDDDPILDSPSEYSFTPGVKKLYAESTGNPIIDAYNKVNLALIKHSKINVEVKSTFFHLLGVMINAGIPMVKSLVGLIRQTDKSPRMRLIIQDLADSISSGMSLSQAMLQFPDVFTEQEIGMIQAGEASGQISKVLEVLAHDAEKSTLIRKKVKSALMYPMVIFTLLIAVIVVMLVYVIPQLSELFASSGSELPLITRIIVAMSDFLINKKIILISALVSIIGIYLVMKRTEKGKYLIDKAKINIPIFGTILKKAFLSRFARSLNNLLDSSVSILKTLEITARSIGNEVYKKRLYLSMEDVKQGIPLADNLNESDLFPPMLVSMVEVGEKTAQLDTIMAQVADFYEQEVDTAVAGISKIIEPIMLITIGITVGAIVAAIILPIMQLSNMAGSL